MYHYPFSNVYDDLRVCVGNNVLPHFKSQTQLSKFPRFLLGIPNNDDFFKESHNRLHMSHRELLEHLKDKEPAYFEGHTWQQISAKTQITTRTLYKIRNQAVEELAEMYALTADLQR